MVILILVLFLFCIALCIIQIVIINQLNKTIRSINLINRSIKKVKNDIHGQGTVVDLELQMICTNLTYLREMKKDISLHAKAIDKFERMAIEANNHAAFVNTEWIKIKNKHAKKDGNNS